MDEIIELYSKKEKIEKLSNKMVRIFHLKEINKKKFLQLYVQFNNNYVDYISYQIDKR